MLARVSLWWLVASEKKEMEAQRSRARYAGVAVGYWYMVPVSCRFYVLYVSLQEFVFERSFPEDIGSIGVGAWRFPSTKRR